MKDNVEGYMESIDPKPWSWRTGQVIPWSPNSTVCQTVTCHSWKTLLKVYESSFEAQKLMYDFNPEVIVPSHLRPKNCLIFFFTNF